MHAWPFGKLGMMMLRSALILLVPASYVVAATSPECAPPPSFVDTSPPDAAPAGQLVSHTEQITIDRSLGVVMDAIDRPLREVVRQSSALPGVSGDYPLTPGAFGPPGTRRMVCLTDGSTLEEQSLERHRDDRSFHFRYEVWNYSSDQARPIAYGVGEFNYSQVDSNRTSIVWVYSFALKRDRFPGYLGSVGNFLFRVGFLDRQYAEMMRNTLNGYKTVAEAQK